MCLSFGRNLGFLFYLFIKINCIYNQRNNQPAVAGERREWGVSVGDGRDDAEGGDDVGAMREVAMSMHAV